MRRKGKARERMEKYRSLQQKWKANRKGAVRQILDSASDAKCQIDPEAIEETYVERWPYHSVHLEIIGKQRPHIFPFMGLSIAEGQVP